MIDNRRLNTAQVLAAGIASLPIPKTDIPDGRDWFTVDEGGFGLTLEALKAGRDINGPMYHGNWYIWRGDCGNYSGCLLQYRKVTDSFSGEPLDVAIEHAADWFGICYG